MSLVDERLDVLASPARARSLLTVRAAISSASSSLRPRSSKPSLMCSYCRSRFLLHACCGIGVLLLLVAFRRYTYPAIAFVHALHRGRWSQDVGHRTGLLAVRF